MDDLNLEEEVRNTREPKKEQSKRRQRMTLVKVALVALIFSFALIACNGKLFEIFLF